MTLAHQHLDQLGDEARHAVLANARSRVVFQLPAADARLMAREMGTILSADDLQGLGAFEVVCQLFAAGTTQAPATGKTRALGPHLVRCRAMIRVHSRQRYGVDETTSSGPCVTVSPVVQPGGLGRRDRAEEGVMSTLLSRSGRVEYPT